MLAENLVSAYKGGQPSFVTVVMNSNGFADLIERLEFVKRVANRNARILDFTRDTRADVQKQSHQLDAACATATACWPRRRSPTRNEAYVVKTALLRREESQLARARRRRHQARLGARRRSRTIERAPGRGRARRPERVAAATNARAAHVHRAAAATSSRASSPPPTRSPRRRTSGAAGTAARPAATTAPARSPTRSPPAGCSPRPLDSTGFMSWGEPGPGRRITVYANAGHAFMVVDGRRFDTSALSGGGTRWTSADAQHRGLRRAPSAGVLAF